jgi:hypothetical protein
MEISAGKYIGKNVTLSDSEGSLRQKSETLRSQRTLPQSDTVF